MTADEHWRYQPIVKWLLEEGRFLSSLDEIVHHLGPRMLAAGAPIWRFRMSMRTLHPLVRATVAIWEREQVKTIHRTSPHGLEGRSEYIGSPASIISQTRAPFRKQLTGLLTKDDHNVLHELKARGATDYLGLPLNFSDGLSASLTLTTDAERGFSDPDIENFTEIAAVLAPIAEVVRSRSASIAVAEAYLGPRTGRRVLKGEITRGDIETIKAAILISDIRDWTGLNNRLSPETLLSRANTYFEIISDAVVAHGGEILKFLGDGVLAIFPTDSDVDDSTACSNALRAARQALRTASDATRPLDLTFGVGMHFGEVLYGNVGSKTRIDFTVLGHAVNLTSRVEGLCSKLQQPLLFSEAFADRLSEPVKQVAEELLKGHSTKSAIFATSLDNTKQS